MVNGRYADWASDVRAGGRADDGLVGGRSAQVVCRHYRGTALADFNGKEYGNEYLTLKEGDRVENLPVSRVRMKRANRAWGAFPSAINIVILVSPVWGGEGGAVVV